MPEGQELLAVFILGLLVLAGFVFMFNLAPNFLVGGDMSIGGISGFADGFYTILFRFVISPALVIGGCWVIWNIMKG